MHARVRGAGCPMCSVDNTSAAEQWLYAEMRQHYPDVCHRRRLQVKGGNVEVDLYVPSLKLAIEYDGPHHRRRVKADQKKNFLLTRAGISLVRIRQLGLPPLMDTNILIIEHDPTAASGLKTCLSQLLAWIDGSGSS